MVSNLDIWRAANLLIKSHGADAELEAARLQDLMFDRGVDEGRLVWVRIRRAIETLRAPSNGEPRKERSFPYSLLSPAINQWDP